MNEKSRFAVIKTGGKQYRVSAGDKVLVEKFPGSPGDGVVLNEVLLVGEPDGSTIVGTPLVKGASVQTRIIAQRKDRKVMSFKKNLKKGYKRKIGHRQHKVELIVESINL